MKSLGLLSESFCHCVVEFECEYRRLELMSRLPLTLHRKDLKGKHNFRTKGCHKMVTGNAKTSPNIGLHARKLLHLLVLFKFSIDMRILLAFKFLLNEIHRLDGFILGRLKQIIKTNLFIFSTDVVIQAMKCELTSDVTFVGDI